MVQISRPGMRWQSARARCAPVRCWTGETVATLEISGVPIPTLYEQYAKLERMTEWSPSLESVTPQPDNPRVSVWVMSVPRALQAASRTVGYPSPNITWEAVLDAPGPPLMTWTSKIFDDGTQQNAGFVPSGAVSFAPTDSPGCALMTLTLAYELPDPIEWWLLAIISSPLVQGVVRGRMRAGMQRFSRTMKSEHDARLARLAAASSGEPSGAGTR